MAHFEVQLLSLLSLVIVGLGLFGHPAVAQSPNTSGATGDTNTQPPTAPMFLGHPLSYWLSQANRTDKAESLDRIVEALPQAKEVTPVLAAAMGKETPVNRARLAGILNQIDPARYAGETSHYAVVRGDYVFVTTAYNTGSALLEVKHAGEANPDSPFRAKEIYFLGPRDFANHHGGVVLAGEYLYGGHGSNLGDVLLVEASPEGFRVQGRFLPPTGAGPAWAHPVIHRGKLYLRHDDLLCCYDLRAYE